MPFSAFAINNAYPRPRATPLNPYAVTAPSYGGPSQDVRDGSAESFGSQGVGYGGASPDVRDGSQESYPNAGRPTYNTNPPPGPPASPTKPVTTPQYDLMQDPGYQAALSQFLGRQGAASSNYLSQAEQYLLGFGSQQLAHQTLDSILPQLESVEQKAGILGQGAHIDLNPFYESFYIHDANGNRVLGADGQPLTIADKDRGFSQLAQLGQGAFNATRNQIDANRLANLAYSSAGARGLQNTAYTNQLNLNNASNQAANTLAQYLSGYQGDLSSAQDTLNNAANSAYDRLQQWALANPSGADPSGQSGGIGSGGSGGSGGKGGKGGSKPSGGSFAPFAAKATANRTGASRNKRQGIFSIH